MNRVRVLAVLALTLACLAWALWGMDVRAVAAALAGFRSVWLLPVLALFGVAVLGRAFRFACLLEQPVSTWTLVSPMQVGFLAISVMPFRLGEFVRPYLLAEYHGVPFGAGMAALVLERLLDMTALLVCLTYVAWFVDVPEGVVVGGVDLLVTGQRAIGTGVVVGGLGVVALAAAGPGAVEVVAGLAERFVPRLAPLARRLLGTLVNGFRALFRRPGAALGAALGTAAMWSSTFGVTAALLAGFDGLPVSFDAAVLDTTTIVTAVALIPTPGFVGAWEAGAVGGLVPYGVDADVARAFAVVHHSTSFVFNVAVGLWFLARQGLSLGQLVRDSNARAAG